jgi:hypothetical protein
LESGVPLMCVVAVISHVPVRMSSLSCPPAANGSPAQAASGSNDFEFIKISRVDHQQGSGF